MLMPKRVKRRKQFRGSMKGKALRGNTISYGDFGLVATEPCWIRSNQDVYKRQPPIRTYIAVRQAATVHISVCVMVYLHTRPIPRWLLNFVQ